MNTSSPQLEGKDLSQTKDPQGVYIFQEMVRVCRESGAGRVAYMWPKSAIDTQPAPKFNYVKLYEPWGWIVGTGIYVDDVERALHRIAWVLFGISGLACALATVLTVGVVRSISRPIQEIAAGLASASDQVHAGATQVSQASQSLAHDASAQAAALEETSASSQEISSMARRNAENSQGSSRHMSKTSEAVVHANQRIAEMTGSMNQIKSSSDKISKIIKVIDEIAFQTNILALNAAVEAARAGEAGMGFAVVADEVRNLAQRSAQAAQDTAALIEDSIQRTRDGAAKLEQVTQSIGEITESSKAVGILVDEVHMGSQEQAQGIDQIAKALTQMEQLTQRAASGAEESAAASEELNAQSVAMKDSVRRLGILITGSSRGASSQKSEWK
jgi:methyl-accepting chemotaxis protein